jgi:hypothetical protein
MNTAHHIDVLSVGDVVTDAFIKLDDNQAWTWEDEATGEMRIAMPFGIRCS